MKLNYAKIFAATVFLITFFYLSFIVIDPDFGQHLRTGKDIAQTREIPNFDNYTHTMPGFQWVDHEWLADFWLFKMYGGGFGWAAKIIFVFFASCPFLAWVLIRRSFWDLLAIFFSFTTFVNFAGVRLQMATFFLFFIEYFILEKYFIKKENKKLFFLLPVIFLLWANIHAGFFGGMVLFGLFVFSDFISEIAKNKKINFKEKILPVGIFFASVGATLANPYDWKLYSEIFNTALSSSLNKFVIEWQPLWQRGGLAAFLLAGIVIFFIIIFFKKIHWPVSVSSAVFLAMSISSVKHWPLFLITAMPVVFYGVEYFREDISASFISKEKINNAFKKIFLILFALTAFLLGWNFYRYEPLRYPEEAVSFIKEKAETGEWQIGNIKIFNKYGWGGYLLWNLPELKLFIDGRMAHWRNENGDSAIKDYIDVIFSKNPENWRNIFYKREINAVLMSNSDKNKSETALKNKLLENGWQAAYQDETALLLFSKDLDF